MRQLRALSCLTFSAAISLAFAGCGGSGSLPSNQVGAAVGSGAASDSKSHVDPPISASGTIASVGTNEFLLQTGSPHGYIHVYTNASTVFTGAKPFTGESVAVVGTGSWSTSIAASSVTQANSADPMNATGTIASVGTNVFLLQTGYPHGYIYVQTNASTKFSGARPFVGESVTVSGTGSWSTSITADTVTQTGAPSPTPVPSSSPTASPSSSPSFPPNGPNTVKIMRSEPGKFGLYQVFDEFNRNLITSPQSVADGPRYGIVWGARPGNAQSWKTNTSRLIATYYMPQETDISFRSWGGSGHDLAWWQANHPDWILYACDPSGTPTNTPAYIAQLPNNIPLDIHNPAVVDYQVRAAANYAIANKYNGLAFDEVLFYNVTGSALGTGYYGCGIYSNGTFIRRYNGQADSNWNNDTVAWVKAAHYILTSDATLAPHHIKMAVNHPAGNITDPNEQAILENTDADLDETGFSDYGNYHASYSLFKTTTDWMRFAQAHGAAPLVVNDYSQSAPLSPVQIEYSLATYMMGNEGGSGLFTGNANAYGAEQYLPQYETTLGRPCGDYYGDAKNPAIYYRSYARALVIVNGGSSVTQVARMPANHTYVDIMGRSISNPMTVASGDAFVLLTTNGCH
ncbi:MAG: hypothetical protein ABI282_06450 [Candidatus Baltobacteraceae bacterium]